MLDILQVLIHFVVGSLLIVTGVNTMGSTLEQANSKLLDKAMRAFSRNKWTSFFTGILLTGLVQSSTAVTILTIGFVDSGIMKLESAVGIIYGANIGTTFTAQFMSFQITQYSRYILIAGCILSFGPMRKFRTAGNVLAGIGLLFSGLELMDKSVNILKNNAFLVQWLQAHSDNVFLCLLAGLVITMLVQSSSATVGMTILLFNGGLLPLSFRCCAYPGGQYRELYCCPDRRHGIQHGGKTDRMGSYHLQYCRRSAGMAFFASILQACTVHDPLDGAGRQPPYCQCPHDIQCAERHAVSADFKVLCEISSAYHSGKETVPPSEGIQAPLMPGFLSVGRTFNTHFQNAILYSVF